MLETSRLTLEHLLEKLGPIEMVLHCPACGTQHVDAPEPSKGWTNPPHKSHLCHGCGAVWRPADVPTVGVAAIRTTGSGDTWSPGRPVMAHQELRQHLLGILQHDGYEYGTGQRAAFDSMVNAYHHEHAVRRLGGLPLHPSGECLARCWPAVRAELEGQEPRR